MPPATISNTFRTTDKRSTDRPTLLLVDDNPHFVEMLAAGLGKVGFKIFSACEVKAGLDQLSKNRTDLILLDQDMPLRNGVAFLRLLRANPRWSDMPVIMLADRFNRQTVLEASRYQLAGYMLKEDFNLADLAARIRLNVRN